MGAKVHGLDALKRKLAALSETSKAEVRAALEKSGSEMVNLAKALAPVDEGALRGSIQMARSGDMAVTVSAGSSSAPYARHAEHGTGDTTARPFFWPAYRVLKKRIRSRTRRAVKKAVSK